MLPGGSYFRRDDVNRATTCKRGLQQMDVKLPELFLHSFGAQAPVGTALLAWDVSFHFNCYSSCGPVARACLRSLLHSALLVNAHSMRAPKLAPSLANPSMHVIEH